MKRLRLIGALACAAALLAVVPALAPASVQVGSSGWQWGNPLPQGNTLRSISFAGLDGYSAGDFGTLLHTTDGGATWSGLLSGTFTNLTEVQAIDAQSVFAAGGCVARRSDDGGATFTRVAFTPVESSCREPFAAGWFVNRQTGFLALADGTVLRTDNNGGSFAQKNPLPGTRAPGGRATPVDLRFLTDQIGVGATSDGKLYRTTDGANSWTLVADTARATHSFFFLDANNGYAVGDGSLFLVTKDGGATWTPKDIGIPPTNLRSIQCATLKLCVMTTDAGTALVRTDDGGDTAKLITPSQDRIFAAGFASPTRIAAGGENGATALSDDAGLTFAPIGGRLSGTYSRVRAGGQAGTAYAPGDNGSLAKTTDGGRTWTRGNVSTSEDVTDVAFPTAQVGYALDSAGGLFRTNDGGATWKPLDTGTTARPFQLAAPSTTTVILAGPTGLRRSTDSGDTFSTVTDKDVVKAKLDDDRPCGQRAVRLGPARPAALDRPRQDVDGAAQAGQEARSREAGRLPRREESATSWPRVAPCSAPPTPASRGRSCSASGPTGPTAWPSRPRPRAIWSSTASATRQARPATCCTRATAVPRGTRSSSCRRRSRAVGSPRCRAAPTTCLAGSRASCSRPAAARPARPAH